MPEVRIDPAIIIVEVVKEKPLDYAHCQSVCGNIV
jgi:hypothetical protein